MVFFFFLTRFRFKMAHFLKIDKFRMNCKYLAKKKLAKSYIIFLLPSAQILFAKKMQPRQLIASLFHYNVNEVHSNLDIMNLEIVNFAIYWNKPSSHFEDLLSILHLISWIIRYIEQKRVWRTCLLYQGLSVY